MFEQRPLSTLIERQIGGGTPPRSNPAFWSGPIPWASVKDFEDASLTLSSTAERISQSGLDASTANLIPAATPLVCTRMAVGRCAITTQPVAINQDVRALTPKTGIQPRYLLRLLDFLRPAAESQAVGSTVKGIRTSDYLAIKVPVAPVIEQPAIARILDTLDTQIEKTQALIAKLEQVKEGLLHDLLTRGIDENGELRPSAEEAPELYKESALGSVPTGWTISTLDSLAQQVIDGTHYTPTYTESGVPFLRVTNLHGRDISSSSFKFVSADEHRILSQRCCPKKGDILLSKNGSVGIAREVTWDWEFSIFVSLALIRLTDNRLTRSDFMTEVLNSPVVQQQIFMRSKQGTVTNLHLEEIRDFLIPVPPSTEQMRILEHLQRFDRRYSEEGASLEKLRSLKSGLMDDLLTGRVRVTPLLYREPAEAT